MNAAGENGTEGDPQEYHGAPQSTAQSAEDGAKACDIQQLDHKQLPLRQNHIVHAIVDPNSGSLAVVGTKGILYDLAVEEVTQDQDDQAEQKAKHLYSSYTKNNVLRSGKPLSA